MKQKKIVITGGIGSGKSTVAQLLAERGYCVWDADVLAREALFFPEIMDEIKKIFGNEAFIKPGELDRKFIRNRIFSSGELKESLENIIHPAIFQLFSERANALAKLAAGAWIFYEASLVLEKGRKENFDACILVMAPRDIRLERLERTRNLSREDAERIMASQMSDEQKALQADFIIHNHDSLIGLEQSIEEMLHFLREKFSRLSI